MEERICDRDETISLEWKVEGVIGWERRWWLWWGDIRRMSWTLQEESEQNEVDVMKKGTDSTGKVMHMW